MAYFPPPGVAIVWSSCCAWLLLAALVSAAEPTGPIVPAFVRFHSQGEAPATGGQLLLGELNCTSCHAVDKSAQSFLHTKQAPILDTVGARVRPEYLQKFLTNPLAAKPGTTMPDPFVGWSEDERRTAVEALTHFLASTGTPGEQRVSTSSIAKGETLFHRVGCTACHDAQRAGAKALPTSIPLGNLASKYTLPSLTQFLDNPHAVRPSGRMPSLNLAGDEARDLAAYLLRDLKDLRLPANLQYAYYEGDWNELPDFAKLTPKSEGETSGFDLAFIPRKDNFAIRFTGTLQITQPGQYTFHVASDDGTKLYIDDTLVVSNDGIHAAASKSGKAVLTAGTHVLVLDYFEGAGEESITAEVQGSGLKRQALENLLVTAKLPKDADKPKFVVDPQLAAQGQTLFASVGCASCHQLKPEDEPRLASTLRAPELAKLKNTDGCLSATPGKGMVNFGLNATQRTALSASLAALQKPPKAIETQEKIVGVMKTFNCYACHQRGELGGVEEARLDYFDSTQKEMGDEGRLPPALTGVGAKLRPEYLKQFFAKAMKERPYMLARMPRYGNQAVEDLHQEFIKVDPAPELKKVETKLTHNELRHSGYMEVGDKGYSCIKCHTWGNLPSTGVQSINMQRMTTRLRQEWFEAYVVDPQVYRPGTRMPSAWPFGHVGLPKLADGKLDTQVRAAWVFLSDGEKARIPLGLGRDPIELVPEQEALIYRNFIEGSGARAIGVGYPDKVNLAFDANEMRLAMIWQGAFIDASRHWTDRGVGYQPPLGDNVLTLVGGAPLAVLSDANTAWPTTPAKEQGYQFRGYQLDSQQQPTFLYRFGAFDIADKPLPSVAGGKTTLQRTLTITTKQSGEHLYWRAAKAGSIKPTSDDTFSIDGKWTLRITGGKPIVRTSDKQEELLVPITLENGQAKIVQEYAW